MQRPPRLRPGDTLAVVAPASTFDRDEFAAGIAEIKDLGLVPRYDDSVFARGPQEYVAGPPALRAQALRAAWRDPEVAGIIAVRGGYGSAQVLPLLDASEIRQHPKPFIGYSDLTSLLTFITGACGQVGFHGPMLAGRLGRGAAGYDRASFQRALFEASPVGELTAPGLEAVVAGEATGPVFGGTVMQLLASLGTPYAFDPPPGYVLFFEEVGERPYRLDRMFTQLVQAGLLARASAVIVGELPRCDEPGGTLTGRGLMADLLAGFPGPVILGFPSGHTTGPALTLPLGVQCRVVAGGAPHIVIEEAAVS
jgi:muramoyltetrapeptide carboxypeptidase